MAETIVTKSTAPSIDGTSGVINPQIAGLIAGENIAALDLVYIKASDGLVYRATAAAANAAAKIAGIAPRAANATEPVTIFTGPGIQFKYSDGNLTPGALLYVGETAGTMSSIATTGDAAGVAQALDTNNVRLIRAY